MKKKIALSLVVALTISVFVGCSKPAEETIGNFTDGTYEGVGEGYKGDIKVSVKVEDGKIKTIDLLEIQDTTGIGDEGAKETINKIIEAQSTEVDAHSGATISSKGTIEAVEVALGLKEAKVKETVEEPKKEEPKEEQEEIKEEEPKKEDPKKEDSKKEEPKKEEVKKEEPKKEEPKKEEIKKEEPKKEEVKKEETKKEEPKKEEKPETPAPEASGYKDGTYVGKAEGFHGNIEMQITIAGGKITAVNINKMDETEGIGDVAVKKIADAVLAKQSGDVAVVSGATYSSTGAIEAVKKALSQAK